MSTTQLTEQTIELPARVVKALAGIGYEVVPLPVVEVECTACRGLGYDPQLDGYQTCPICQGWRVCRWPVTAAL